MDMFAENLICGEDGERGVGARTEREAYSKLVYIDRQLELDILGALKMVRK